MMPRAIIIQRTDSITVMPLPRPGNSSTPWAKTGVSAARRTPAVCRVKAVLLTQYLLMGFVNIFEFFMIFLEDPQHIGIKM